MSANSPAPRKDREKDRAAAFSCVVNQEPAAPVPGLESLKLPTAFAVLTRFC
jgi:hypothetical protein